MRQISPKVKHKVVISGLAMFIFLLGFIVVNIKTNLFPEFNKKIGEVAGVALTGMDKFFNVSLSNASATAPYQDVQGNVGVSGFLGIGTAAPLSKLNVIGGPIFVGPTPYRGDASLHIGSAYGSFGRLTQINPSVNGAAALNIMASLDGAGNGQWYSWGVNANKWTISPGTSFSGTGLTVDSSGNVSVSGTITAPTFSGNATSATTATTLNGWGLYVNGRPRMYDIGCAGNWGSSCDANGSGWTDYADTAGSSGNADTVDGYHMNQSVTIDSFVSMAGYHARAGMYGGYGGNWMNSDWTGSCIRFWVDTSNTGAICSSDQRLKKDVHTLDDYSGLVAINQLNPVSFNWKAPQQGDPTNLQYGLLAQDVQKVFPEMVRNTGMKSELTPDGTLMVEYQSLFAPIIKAIQELDKKISSIWDAINTSLDRIAILTQKVEAQQKEIDILKEEINRLKQ